MKLFLAIALLVGVYMYMLIHTTDTVLGQTEQLNHTYQYATDRADQFAANN